MYKEKIRSIVEDTTTKTGRRFDIVIQIIIIVSLLAYATETLPSIGKKMRDLLHVFELISIVIFSIEYLLRIYVAKKRLGYIFSFYGIIDLISILPFYLGSFLDLRGLRIFRIFRIFRLFKLVRYNQAIERFKVASQIVKEEIILFLILSMIFVFISSAGIYYFEHDAQPNVFPSIFHSFWWAIVTLTTVGYGDAYPITVGGKIFTSFVLLIGVGIVTIPAGLVATALAKAREKEKKA
jgi:voltage-gated potassium channel